MQQSTAFRMSAVVGFLAVALGAFGAHGLKDVLARHETTAIWQTAVLYHLVHGVVLLALTLAPSIPSASASPSATGTGTSGRSWRQGPWWCFALGLLVFSGSLYVLGVTGLRVLGAITPIGGVLLLAGWGWLAVQGRRE